MTGLTDALVRALRVRLKTLHLHILHCCLTACMQRRELWCRAKRQKMVLMIALVVEAESAVDRYDSGVS